MARTRARHNGEGSIYPYRNGFAAYAWVTTPTGKRARKYVYGSTRQATHEKWIKLIQVARQGPVATSTPTVGRYLHYWLTEVIEPNSAPTTGTTYETFIRLHIVPYLGDKKLGRLNASDVQAWINKLAKVCQCCAQGKDEARPRAKRQCCALGKCCETRLSSRSLSDVRACLRAALSHACDVDELITRNPAAKVKVPKVRSRRGQAWSTDEARRFLESAKSDGDPLYTAYVLILVLGLRKGEVLGLGWDEVTLDESKLYVGWQLQRVGGKLLRREVKTEASEAGLPLPDLCAAALKLRKSAQDTDREHAGRAWQDRHGLVFTTRYGRPIEPRNFYRSWDHRCRKAGVRKITVHDARRTCASLLVDLDVHPRVIMAVLRHAQITVTMQIYAQASSKKTVDALRRLGASLDE